MAALITTRDLKIGDIILSTTSAIDSAIIREGTASQYSHSALYAGFVQGLDGKGVRTRVIEATRKDGVFDPTLFKAMNKPNLTLMSVYRYPNLHPGQGISIIVYARNQLKKKYDLPGAAGSGVTSVPGALLTFAVMGAKGLAAGIAADALNRKNPEVRFFCSELVAFAYKRGVGIDLGSAPASTTPADLANLKTLIYIGDLKRK